MADVICNIAKGRIVEFYNRVKSDDPATSVFKWICFDAGAATDDQLRDADTVAAIVALGTERAATGWGRKVLTQAELAALPAPDDAGNTYKITLPNPTWTAVTAGAVTDLILAYFPDTGGADSTGIPCIVFDFAITPDGSDVTATVNASGILSAA